MHTKGIPRSFSNTVVSRFISPFRHRHDGGVLAVHVRLLLQACRGLTGQLFPLLLFLPRTSTPKIYQALYSCIIILPLLLRLQACSGLTRAGYGVVQSSTLLDE